jgi:hypothetical protein
MVDYNGEERRKDNVENGLYIKFSLKDYLETQFKITHQEIDVIHKKLESLPCGVQKTRVDSLEQDNKNIWHWLYGIIFFVIIGGIVLGIFLK